MSAMKEFAEDVSIEMGFGGEINDAVLSEAQRRLDSDKETTIEENREE